LYRLLFALVLLCTLALAGPAGATPPDYLASEASPICWGADRAAFLVRSHGNAGSHYVSNVAWHLVMVDTRTSVAEWQDHGGLSANHVDVMEEGDVPQVSYSQGDGTSLGAAIEGWGLQSCTPWDASWVRGPEQGRYGISVSEAGIFLEYGGRRRELEISGTWDPGMLATGQFPWMDQPPKLESVEPISTLGDSERLELRHTVDLETRQLLVVRVISEFGNRDVLMGSPKSSLIRSKAWLINARGLDDHRAGQFDRSAWWFAEALRLDPTFETALYNLACAQARLGNVPQAVHNLSLLPGSAALRGKVEGDGDFATVLKDPQMVEFLDGLVR
jgi:hypothetical protein